MNTRAFVVVILTMSACSSPPPASDTGRVVTRDVGGSACMTPPGGRLDGERCGCEEDCRPSANCATELSEGWPGGACSAACDPADGADACTDNADCIVPDTLTFGTCVPRCTNTGDCPLGRSCDGAHCYIVCQTDDDCLAGSCDGYTGLCREQNDGAGLNEPCARPEDCRSRLCNSMGYCISFCSIERQGCPDDGHCLPGDGPMESDLGVCYARCMVDEDCVTGQVCRLATIPGATVRVCTLS